MSNADQLRILADAMEVERQGHAFYQEAANLVQDANGKAVFLSIAEDEVEHLKLLQAEYDALTAGRGWLELTEARTAEGAFKLFPDVRDAAFMIPDGTTDEQALQLAMDLEQKGYTMYDTSVAQAGDPQAAALFKFLAGQENEHYVYLQETLDYLRTKGVWYFQDRERPIFDGGI